MTMEQGGSGLPAGWHQMAGSVEIVAGTPGRQRAAAVGHLLREAAGAGCRTWLLPCDADVGGVWAGLRPFFQSIVDEQLNANPQLLRRHDYELAHVLPSLCEVFPVRHESLTDISLGFERVRNYPADRAYRILHGLIDLLCELQSPGERWVLACDSLDRIGALGRRFLGELMRRRGSALRLVLLAIVAPAAADEVGGWFIGGSPLRRTTWRCSAEMEEKTEGAEARERYRSLRRIVPENLFLLEERLSELIDAARSAGLADQLFLWQLKALEVYPMLGFYEDALRYGPPVRAAIDRVAPEDPNLRYMVFFKTLISLLSTGRVEEGRQLALSEGLELSERTDPVLRAQLFYLIAMLYVRFLPVKDFELGERYLERGLAEVERIEEPQDQVFNRVFNRNGLALVRHRQGRYQEAIELCSEGLRAMSAHFTADRHRLHRSVLIYNIAQVYSAIGSHQEAIEQFSAAIALDPYYSEYYNDRGSLYLQLDRLIEADADFRTAIELSAPYPEVHTNLGQCCRRMGRTAEAITEYSRALDLNPANSLALLGRAQAYDTVGRLGEAIADYDLVLAQEPANWEVRANRGVLQFQRGELDAALHDLNAAIQLAPAMAPLHENRSILLAAMGDAAGAALDHERYLELATQPAPPSRGEKKAAASETAFGGRL